LELSRAIRKQTSCAKPLAFGQDGVLRLAIANGVTTCRPLPPVEPEVIEVVAHFPRRFDDRREGRVRPRIEIKDQAAWNLRLPRLAIPGMELDTVDLGHSGKALARQLHRLVVVAADQLRVRGDVTNSGSRGPSRAPAYGQQFLPPDLISLPMSRPYIFVKISETITPAGSSQPA
jgi:hypothetical protein